MELSSAAVSASAKACGKGPRTRKRDMAQTPSDPAPAHPKCGILLTRHDPVANRESAAHVQGQPECRILRHRIERWTNLRQRSLGQPCHCGEIQQCGLAAMEAGERQPCGSGERKRDDDETEE